MNRKITTLYEKLPEVFFQKEPHSFEEDVSDENDIFKLEHPLKEISDASITEIIKQFQKRDPNSIKKRIKEQGVEALAWYHSFHIKPVESWGVYIRWDGLEYLFYRIIEEISVSEKLAFRYALQVLLDHEFFHFLVDIYSGKVELYTKQSKYRDYLRNYYDKNWPDCIEESLANRQVMERLHSSGSQVQKNHRLKFASFLKQFFHEQPDGYRRWWRFRKSKFKTGKIELCNIIAYGKKDNYPIDQLSPPIVSVNEVPIYFVVSSQRKITEIPSTLSLVVKVRKFLRFLKRNGFKRIRQDGADAIFRDNGNIVEVSIHPGRTVHPKTIKDVQVALGMSRKEFVESL